MGRGVPPGNKIPVSAKECKPRERTEGPALHGSRKMGLVWRLGRFRRHTKTWSLLQFLILLSSKLKLAQATGVSPPITVATVTLTATVTDSLGHRNSLCWSQPPS